MNYNYSSTFQGQKVRIDNQVFVDCVFRNCQLIYGGSSSFTLEDCKFYDCTWGFDGAAANTIGFMKMIYNDLGDDGEQLINSIFNSIIMSKHKVVDEDLPNNIDAE